MKRNCLLCCFVLLLLLPRARVSEDLPLVNFISDLRTIQFGHSFPRHGLMLLHFITSKLNIDQNDRIWPTFLPLKCEFGFHKYKNYENIFPPVRRTDAYYAVGNLNTKRYIGATQLPPYVTKNYNITNSDNIDRNRDRIVIRMTQDSKVVEGMYITQHFSNKCKYDPHQTFRVGVNLLKEIKLKSGNWKESLSVFLSESDYSSEMNEPLTDLGEYKASLQLYVKDGYACAQLYVDKTFQNWEDKFKNSWVGFYASHCYVNKQYSTYQWAIKFSKQGSNENFDIYKYESSMSMAPGAQARFFFDNDYDSLASTEPWES